jgi:hypothetical protein
MNLQDLQHAFQAHVLQGDLAISRQVRSSGALDVAGRLGVYRHAYTARLVEALRESYPALASTTGDEAFAALARGYLADHPSATASIRWFGHALADHLDAIATDERGAMLADLARWEWTLAAAFDGADQAAVGLEAAGSIAAGDWPSLRFTLHPNLQRTTLSTNAIEFWRAAGDDSAYPAMPLRMPPMEWIAWRRDLVTSFRSLGFEEARALEAAGRGQTFGEICADLAMRVGDDAAPLQAATFLKQWLLDGWLTSLE